MNNMTAKTLRITGAILYFIGGLILVPAGLVFLASPNTLLMAGPIVLLLPLVGLTLATGGRWMTRKAKSL